MTTFLYLTRRVLQAIVVIFIVTIVVFCLLHALPGGPARGILGPQASAQQLADFNHDQGLDKSLPVQYVYYLGRLLHGDFGTSYTLNEPVSQLIVQRLPKTLVLTVLSAVIGLLLAIPLGMWQAVRRNKAVDYVATTLSFIAYSTPVYFLGLILVLVFSQILPILPPQAPQGDTLAQVFADPQGLVLPVVAGAASMVAVFSRYMRAATLENLSEDYVRTARAGARVGAPCCGATCSATPSRPSWPCSVTTCRSSSADRSSSSSCSTTREWACCSGPRRSPPTTRCCSAASSSSRSRPSSARSSPTSCSASSIHE